MAAALGVLPSDFTYAGIKDKRAVTYQSMVVKKVSPQRYFWESFAGFCPFFFYGFTNSGNEVKNFKKRRKENRARLFAAV